eukprot:4341490-Heterocapsa_arctica.AAC.1
MGEDRKRASSLSRSTIPAAARRDMRLHGKCRNGRAEVRKGEKGQASTHGGEKIGKRGKKTAGRNVRSQSGKLGIMKS